MTVLIIFLAAKMVILTVTGFVLYKTLGPELRAPGSQKQLPPGVKCVYCQATPALFHSEEQRWEGNELVLVRTYECRSCHMPFWQLERVKTIEQKTL